MPHSELFLLLPVYKDAPGQPFYATTIDIMSEQEFADFISRLNELRSFFTHENYYGYYDAENVKAFLFPVTVLRECYPDGMTRLRKILYDWGEDWRQSRQHREDEQFLLYDFPIGNDTLCEITRRKNNTSASEKVTYLLVNHNGISYHNKTLQTRDRAQQSEIDVCPAQIPNLAEWFEHNRRPARTYNWNPKHGEFGKGAHPDNKGSKVSVLRCGRKDAGKLLKKAIGEEFCAKTLFCYDSALNACIEFKHEGANTYHAFHLDDEDERRIPDGIKDKIETLFGIHLKSAH